MRTITRAVFAALILCLGWTVDAWSDYAYYDANGQPWVVREEPDKQYADEEAWAEAVVENTPVPPSSLPVVPATPAAPAPYRYYWIAPAY